MAAGDFVAPDTLTSGEAYFSANAEYLEALAGGNPESPPAPPPAFAFKPVLAVSDIPLLQCEARQVGVLHIINAYRFHGFRTADLDPLKFRDPPQVPELDPATHGLTPGDLDQEFETGSLAGPPRDTLRNILARLRRAYSGTLAAEYMHITDTAQKRWLQQRLETLEERPGVDAERRLWLLGQLIAAETLEKVIHSRFVGQKRFSLEGAEAFIPLVNYLLEKAAAAGVEEIGMGMAHRGRLNVLQNVLGRSAIALFEHEDLTAPEGALSGDVKYHQGYARQVETLAGPIRVALAFNPSHLEAVTPAVLGWVRAQQHKRGDQEGQLVMALLVHGDAAFAGQGVVMETLAMSATRGYSTGGSVHVVINNQIGFTTSDPRDSRSSLYATDVMKMVEAPVLHVNGDDPEAVLRAVEIAFDYRATFHHDIAIDLVCYRRLGHNEQDEPMVTQPAMYRKIRERRSVTDLYAEQLVHAGSLSGDQPQAIVEAYKRQLDATPVRTDRPYTAYVADWRPYRAHDWRAPADTAVARDRLRELGTRLCNLPPGFAAHPRVIMVLGTRRQMAEGSLPVDWGMAEALAFATLLTEGHGVRVSGQDSGRGTFFHRHAKLHDQNRQPREEGTFVPLQHLAPDQAHFLVVDSLLSEAAVLGFEYGYASSSPNELVIWEAQFGDFANVAQVVIDQFIAAGEAKWGRLNGLTLFLPHGYEGQGPEHSSGRIERFLQLCAQDNIQVTQPSTAGQFFHLLRRQVLRPYRKPLVVFTPKSLLRHPDAASSLTELDSGSFQAVLGSRVQATDTAVTRLVFCSGRVYFDLLAHWRKGGCGHVALARVEQLYPLPDQELVTEMLRYPRLQEIVWAQDEPKNQGAWRFMAFHLRQLSRLPLRYAGRPESATPATGFASLHKAQNEELVQAALG